MFSKFKKAERALSMGKEQLSKLNQTVKSLEYDIAALKERSLSSLQLDDLRRPTSFLLFRFKVNPKKSLTYHIRLIYLPLAMKF